MWGSIALAEVRFRFESRLCTMSMMLEIQRHVARFDLTVEIFAVARKYIRFPISDIRALGNVRIKIQKYQVSTKETTSV